MLKFAICVAAALFVIPNVGSTPLMANPSYHTSPISTLSWTTDYQAALKQAKAENKTVFLFFTGSDWCTWCHKLEQEVLDTQEFANLSGNKFIFVKLDYPKKSSLSSAVKQQNDQLLKKYGVKSYPSVILVDGDGNVLANTGYQAGGAQKYASHLDSIAPKTTGNTYLAAVAEFEKNEALLDKGSLSVEETIAPLVKYLSGSNNKDGWRLEVTIAEVYSTHQNAQEALKWATKARDHAPNDSKEALNQLIAKLESNINSDIALDH